MNAWFARLLGGAACTVGVLAMGMGVAQADDQGHGLVDVKATVKVATHHSSSHHTTAKKASPVRVKAKVAVPVVHVKAAVRIGSKARHTAKPQSARRTTPVVRAKAAPVKAKVSVGHTHRAKASRPVVRAKVSVGGVVKAKAVVTKRSPVKNTATRVRSAVAAKVIVTTHEQALIGRPVVPSVVSDTSARVLDIPVLACVRINAGDCGSGSSLPGSANSGGIIPSVANDTSVVVLDIPVNACVRINAGNCGGQSTNPAPNPALPTVGTDLITTVGDVVDGAVCLRINGGSCGGGSPETAGPGTGTEPNGPGTDAGTGTGTDTDFDTENPPAGDSSNDVAQAGSNSGGAYANGAAALTAGGYGADRGLASTGASSALLGLLLAGLLSLLAAGLLLRRRRVS